MIARHHSLVRQAAALLAAIAAFVPMRAAAAVGTPAAQKEKKIVLAQPTPQQVAWQDREIGMFVHFAPNTWTDKEGDDLTTPLDKINPTQLDVNQWIDAAEALGAKLIVFVAKHEGGFCMWQTDTTDYGIKNTPWRDGKGDVLGDLAAACRKRGMKLGVYLSPKDTKHGAKVGGVCDTPAAQAAYDALYRRQLTEVLSRYGEMSEVWFDGSTRVEVGDILKKYAPHAMIFQGKYATIRWVGNEEGVAPYPCWNALPEAAAKSGVATAADGTPDGSAWMPCECDVSLRRDWFWNTHNEPTIKSLDHLMDIYMRSVGHGANLLLNLTPDTTGRIPDADVKRAAEFGAEIRRRFGTPRAEVSGASSLLELRLSSPTKIDSVVTMEDIRHGERVRAYAVDAWTGNGWLEVCRGTAIGHKKIDQFPPIETTLLRLRILESAADPQIRRFAVAN